MDLLYMPGTVIYTLCVGEKKKCARCLETKLSGDFARRSDRPCGFQSSCKKCLNAYHKARRVRRPEVYAKYARREHFKNNYRITIDDFDKMMSSQRESCLGCGRHKSEFKRTLDVDHCHKTGKVRGLLCANCNRALGYAKDSPAILRALASYLESR